MSEFTVDTRYFFRTEKSDYVGTVIAERDGYLLLSRGSIIKDCGWLESSLKTGNFLTSYKILGIMYLQTHKIEMFVVFNPENDIL